MTSLVEQHSPARFVALVPAAGRGMRFGLATPKQYQAIEKQPLIAHTLRALLDVPWISAVHVVLAPDDTVAVSDPTLIDLTTQWREKLCWHSVGGATRQASVVAGLRRIAPDSPDTWVMVHDAARPGVRRAQLEALRSVLSDHAVPADGALLALPVADTLKLAGVDPGGDQRRVVAARTVSRDKLWQAQTPQVFRWGALTNALGDAIASGDDTLTDESSAMERAGYKPVLVPGSWHNLKVTTAPDLGLAALALRQKQPEEDQS